MSAESRWLKTLKQVQRWEATSDPEYPFSTTWCNQELHIRFNRAKNTTSMTLLVDGSPVLDFDDWPDRSF
ncbi:MAG: hypothetical protein SCI25_02700 [Desulfuromonadales bacterium]|nr:hypothetical protein [Desulfuromonadales bacterium]MDW7757686.1 hypothetical protein [Desulfuromonadales bacterium]